MPACIFVHTSKGVLYLYTAWLLCCLTYYIKRQFQSQGYAGQVTLKPAFFVYRQMKIPQNIEEIIEELMDQYLEDDGIYPITDLIRDGEPDNDKASDIANSWIFLD